MLHYTYVHVLPLTMSKLKGKKLELTKMTMPEGVPERWRKWHQGKPYYFRGDYFCCLKQWLETKENLERAKKKHGETTSTNFSQKFRYRTSPIPL